MVPFDPLHTALCKEVSGREKAVRHAILKVRKILTYLSQLQYIPCTLSASLIMLLQHMHISSKESPSSPSTAGIICFMPKATFAALKNFEIFTMIP
jgi:hypothetical protein